MRHQMATKKLNRAVGPRRSLLNNLLAQLFTYESIATTEAKAKTVKAFADRLIYQAKPQTMAVRRRLQSKLTDPLVLKKLVDDIAQRYPGVSSGFTRISRLGPRRGDSALMVKLELIKKGLINKPVQKSEKDESEVTKKKILKANHLKNQE